MERSNRKKYIQIDCETGSKEIFPGFDKIESETESDIENFLEDCGAEYIAEEPILDNKRRKPSTSNTSSNSPC